MKTLTVKISIDHILDCILLVAIQNRLTNYLFGVAFSLSQRALVWRDIDIYSNSQIHKDIKQINLLITHGINPGPDPFLSESQQHYHPVLSSSLHLQKIAETWIL